MVLLSHTFALGGFGYDPLGRFSDRRISLGTFAVYGFFVLSGYLIAKSYSTLSGPVRYLWHRALRILPAFWVCLVLTSCVLGPVAYALDHHSVLPYFQNTVDGPFQYLHANYALFIANHGIGGVFAHNPLPLTFNDSLWTLEAEARCYLAVAILGMLGILRRARLLLPLLTVALWALAVAGPNLPDNQLIPHPSYVPLYLYFAIGATLYLYRGYLTLRFPLFLGALILAVLAFKVGPVPLLLPAALSYALFYLAARLPFDHFDRRMDLSYGLYIYAFPIQQTLALAGLNHYGVIPFLVGSLLVSVALAYLSWHLIEAPSLRLKGWQPFGAPAVVGDESSRRRLSPPAAGAPRC
jgi:peptidoglycan/LPS O-acetylase OafA/YrhL